MKAPLRQIVANKLRGIVHKVAGKLQTPWLTLFRLVQRLQLLYKPPAMEIVFGVMAGVFGLSFATVCSADCIPSIKPHRER
jgi:hypothetical protein